MMWWLPRVLGWGGEWIGNARLFPFCKEHCRWKSRAALISWHCRASVPYFALSFRLVRVCVCVCVLVAVSSIADILRVPTGAGRKVLEMVSSRHTVTRHSCRCWRKTW